MEREIARGESAQPSRRSLLRTAIWLGLTGLSLYLVAPSLLDTLGSWRELDRFGAGWLVVMLALQAAALGCLWILQHLALHTGSWYAVITSHLAGNAMAKIAPGGNAVGAALQYRLLVESGISRTRAVSALTATNVMTFGVVLALPVMAIPAIVRGGVHRSLIEATIIGVAAFLALAGIGAASLASNRPLAWLGRTIQRVRTRTRPSGNPGTGLPARLLRERDSILATLGPSWRRALLATTGRWAFDYATLLAALAAVGSRPRPSLVLLAFCMAQILTQIPLTPGGLGFVEAGLTATLALAGVSGGAAVLATFAYRLFSYWLALPAGLGAFVLHRRRFGGAAASS